MKKFEIVDLIEDLGFQSLANWLDSNECTYSEAINHIRYERTIQSEEEFPIEIFNQVFDLIELFFNLPTKKESIMDLNQYQKVRMLCGVNTRVITCKYLGPTNTQGSRIKLYDRHFKQSVTISYNYEFSNAVEGAVDYLLTLGFDVVGMNSSAIREEYIIIVNNWDCEQQLVELVEVTK